MAAQIDIIIKDLVRFTEKRITSIGLGITANLKRDTPRDTSWARSNWIGSKRTPAVALKEPSGRPSGADVAQARGAQAAGEAALASYNLADGSLFVTNNVPYIVPLNSGSSKQAGAGFVERAIEQAIREGR